MKKLYVALLLAIVVTASCKREVYFTQNQWGDIFKKYGIDSACFELKDNNHDQLFIYNLERASRRYSPASTFKIMNSLIALETNVAPDENMVIAWDGIERRPEWNKDMNMRDAFRVSCVPYYQEIARRIGQTDMQKALDSVAYGNMRIGSKIDEFWLNDTLQISADEQVTLNKKLYFDKLPFSQRSQRIVRSLMLREDSATYKLYYKTGTSIPIRSGKKNVLAWIVGFVEKKETQKAVMSNKEETNYKPYFFAMNFETADTNMNTQEVRLNILKEILRERKIIVNTPQTK